jgi:hydrogenase 3 maturation protease
VTPHQAALKQKLSNALRIAVLGVGSELRGDDIAGLLAAQQIEKAITKQTTSQEIRVFIGETAPENLTGQIKEFQPTHLIIIDAAELNKEPGHIEVMGLETIGGATFCTHSLPLNVIISYLLESFKFEPIVIGIQPKTITFGAQPTKEVVAASKNISKTITSLLISK